MHTRNSALRGISNMWRGLVALFTFIAWKSLMTLFTLMFILFGFAGEAGADPFKDCIMACENVDDAEKTACKKACKKDGGEPVKATTPNKTRWCAKEGTRVPREEWSRSRCHKPKGEPEPEADYDEDGIVDDDDKCPKEPEDKDGFEDEDGCPETDNDGDGILDVNDGKDDGSGFGSCRNEPEDKDGFQDEDGCPECNGKMLTNCELAVLLFGDGTEDNPGLVAEFQGFIAIGRCLFWLLVVIAILLALNTMVARQNAIANSQIRDHLMGIQPKSSRLERLKRWWHQWKVARQRRKAAKPTPLSTKQRQKPQEKSHVTQEGPRETQGWQEPPESYDFGD